MWPQLLREHAEVQRIKAEDQEAEQFWAKGLGPTDIGDELAQVAFCLKCACYAVNVFSLSAEALHEECSLDTSSALQGHGILCNAAAPAAILQHVWQSSLCLLCGSFDHVILTRTPSHPGFTFG